MVPKPASTPKLRRCSHIYLTTSTEPRHAQGPYRTFDGGASWTQVIKEGDLTVDRQRFIHAFSVTVHPKWRDTVYFCSTTHGLFRSETAGESWQEVNGIPFTGVHNVVIDPADDETIRVRTHGGGVWKGPARGT